MKIAVIASRFPWPLEKGDKLRLYHQLLYLAQRHEVCLIALSSNQREEIPRELSDYVKDIHIIKLSSFWQKIQAAVNFALGQSAYVGYFQQIGAKRKVHKILALWEPDVIYAQLIRTSWYVQALPFPKVMDLMDCFSAGIGRLAKRKSNVIARKIYSSEAAQLAEQERNAFNEFDHCTIISDRDRKELPILSVDQVSVISNGIDTSFFMPDHGVTKAHDLVFVGNLGYAPNEQAVLTLHEWYLKKYGSSGGPSVFIAGARPTARIQAIKHKDWTIAGWQEDIRAAYRCGRIFVAPLFSGSGLQNKILEAMSIQLPCITTDIVNDSILAKPNADILIANDQDSFFKQVEHLLADENLRKKIGNNARTFVVNNYGWDEFNHKLNQLIIETGSCQQKQFQTSN